jgi:DNA-binding LacI/PurR family transcriptional regulator
VVTNIENPFFAALSREMEQAAKEKSYQLMIASSNYDADREKEAVRMFKDSSACGIITCPSPGSDTGAIYSELYDLPYVFVARKPLGLKADSVLVENFNAAKLISKHFVAEGFMNFGYLGIEMNSNDQRFSGYKYGLEELGCDIPEENIFKTNEMTYTDICPEMFEFLEKAPKPFAVFCFHDLLALLLMKACNKLGLDIPGDVAIAGFDNLPFASKISPPLTTVGYPLKSMARLALNRLLEKVDNANASADPVNLQVEPKLYVRESSSAKASTMEHRIVSQDLIYQAS